MMFSVGDVIYLIPSEHWPFLNKTGPYVVIYTMRDAFYVLDNDGYFILVVPDMVDKRRTKKTHRNNGTNKLSNKSVS